MESCLKKFLKTIRLTLMILINQISSMKIDYRVKILCGKVTILLIYLFHYKLKISHMPMVLVIQGLMP